MVWFAAVAARRDEERILKMLMNSHRSTRLKTRRPVLVLATILLCGVRHVAAVEIQVGQGSAAPGGSIDIPIYMAGSGNNVAGVQMNLTWDGGCMAINQGSGSSAQCKSNPATGKNVQTSIGKAPCGGNPNCMTAFFLSISDPSPIPDGLLFACTFTVSSAPSSTSCTIGISNVIAAEPKGGRVAVTANGGAVYVSGGGGTGRAGMGSGGIGGAPLPPPVVVGPGGAGPSGAGSTGSGTTGQGAPAAKPGSHGGSTAPVPGQGGTALYGEAGAEATLAPTEAAAATAAPRRTAQGTPAPGTPASAKTPTPRTATPGARTPTAAAGTPTAAGTPSPKP